MQNRKIIFGLIALLASVFTCTVQAQDTRDPEAAEEAQHENLDTLPKNSE